MLVKDIETLKRFLPVDFTTKAKTISPAFEVVERNFIVKILGAALYNKLCASIQNANQTSDEKELLEKILPVLAPLSYHASIASLNTRFSDSGMFTATGGDKERLPKWHFEEIKLELLTNGYNAIDPLFDFLQNGNGKDWFADWTKAAFMAEFKSLFIRNAKEFSDQIDIKDSTWLYLRLKSHIQQVEKLYLRSEIGADFYNELKGKLLTGLSTDENNLLPLIQGPLAHFAYASALRDPLFRQEMINLSMIRNDSFNIQQSESNVNGYFSAMANEKEAIGQSLLGLLTDELNLRATSAIFQTYFNSNKYKGTVATNQSSSYNNATSESTFFM